MSHENTRGNLSHHKAVHAADPAKALDTIYEKVITGILIGVAILAFCVYVLSR
jgi:hypothetical protein